MHPSTAFHLGHGSGQTPTFLSPDIVGGLSSSRLAPEAARQSCRIPLWRANNIRTGCEQMNGHCVLYIVPGVYVYTVHCNS